MSNKTVTISVMAGETLAKGTPVKWAAELDAKSLGAVNSGSIGVLLNGSTSGSYCTVVVSGPVKVRCADANVDKFDHVLFDDQTTKAHSGSNLIMGQALEDGYAADGSSNQGLILINLFADKSNS